MQTISERKNCHVIQSSIASSAGIRVQLQLLICLGSRIKSKNRDKQLTFIVRVSPSDFT